MHSLRNQLRLWPQTTLNDTSNLRTLSSLTEVAISITSFSGTPLLRSNKVAVLFRTKTVICAKWLSQSGIQLKNFKKPSMLKVPLCKDLDGDGYFTTKDPACLNTVRQPTKIRLLTLARAWFPFSRSTSGNMLTTWTTRTCVPPSLRKCGESLTGKKSKKDSRLPKL